MVKAVLIIITSIVGFFWLGLIAVGEPIAAITAGIAGIIALFIYIIRKDWRD